MLLMLVSIDVRSQRADVKTTVGRRCRVGLGLCGAAIRRGGLVDAGAVGGVGYGDGRVDHFELVDGFDAEVGEGEDSGGLGGFGGALRADDRS
jgi:hypothetical protein